MKAEEKVKELSGYIKEALTPVIKNDYVLFDVPYYTNVGDTLIWQGTLDFLKDIPYHCRHMTDADTTVLPRLSRDICILLQGGGNFGDLWPKHQIFRKKIIEKYPENQIIILPQSIHWTEKAHLIEDAAFFSKYPNTTICVRDRASFDILEEFYPANKRLLLPDMAFCIDVDKYYRDEEKAGASLFVKRDDKELAGLRFFNIVPDDAHVGDWLGMGDVEQLQRWVYSLEKYAGMLDRHIGTGLKQRVTDFFWSHYFRKAQVQHAVSSISPYENIFTTRMHAGILAVILGKKNITMFDNSYHKLSGFADAWLSDVEGLNVIGDYNKR